MGKRTVGKGVGLSLGCVINRNRCIGDVIDEPFSCMTFGLRRFMFMFMY